MVHRHESTVSMGLEQVEWNCLIILALRRLFSFSRTRKTSATKILRARSPNRIKRLARSMNDTLTIFHIAIENSEMLRITATRWPVTTSNQFRNLPNAPWYRSRCCKAACDVLSKSRWTWLYCAYYAECVCSGKIGVQDKLFNTLYQVCQY